MPEYAVSQLPEILFGAGSRFKLAERLPDRGKCILVCGKHFSDRRAKEIARLFEGHEYTVFVLPHGEPDLAVIDDLRRAASGCAALAAIGGGSAIDAAKAAALLLDAELPTRNYFYGKAKPPVRRVFFAALPTTAGTGAEMTGNAVLTDRTTNIKQSLRGPHMKPDLAIVDPELLADCPASVMASSGFDALTQALESLVSRKANPFTRLLAGKAKDALLENLEKACAHEANAMASVAEASMFTGIAFSDSGLGAVHGIGHPLGSICHIPHGTSCALLLPHVLKINHAGYRALGIDPDALLRDVLALRDKLGLPENARAYRLAPEHFDFIVANCRSGSMKCNPVPLSDDDVRKLLEELL